MPLSLPNLDDLRWKDLVAEGRTILPAAAPAWTNHNPSDPGITLIELFAYLSEKLMFQLNRINDSNVAEFLSLINGSDWKKKKGLAHATDLSIPESRAALRAAVDDDEKRKSARSLLELTRAVTPSDFESLACAVPGVGRAKCVPQRNLDTDDPAARKMDVPGHVSLVVLSEAAIHPAPELLAHVRQALEPARLLTTRVHVVAPRYVVAGFRVTVNPIRDVLPEELRKRVVERLTTFLDSHRGWFDGNGWPWGRGIYISELYQVLGEIHGVDRVGPTRNSGGVPLDEILLDPSHAERIQRNERGGIEEAELNPDELFAPRIDPANIVITAHL